MPGGVDPAFAQFGRAEEGVDGAAVRELDRRPLPAGRLELGEPGDVPNSISYSSAAIETPFVSSSTSAGQRSSTS